MRIGIGARFAGHGIGRNTLELISHVVTAAWANRHLVFVSKPLAFKVHLNRDWGQYFRNIEVGAPQ